MLSYGIHISSTTFIFLCLVSTVSTEYLSLCDSLNDIEGNNNDATTNELKTRRVRALCDAIQSSRTISDQDNELDSIPDFDLTQINSDNDANQILKRFRRGRFSSGGRSSSGGSRFSSSSSRSSSSGSRFFSSRSSSSSSGGSRIFSRSSSSSSGSSGSRIFSRSSSSSSGSSSGSSGSRIFSRSSSSSSGSSSGSSGSRIFSRSSSSSGSGGSGSSHTGGHRIRSAVRTIFRHSPSSKPGISSGSSGIPGSSGGMKPSFGDRFSHSVRSGGHSFGSGGFGGSGSSGGGAHVWARAGKKFLPVAARFGKRYYQRRKYNKAMYAGAGAGAGYYAGSRMSHHHHSHYYPYEEHYGYPPVVDTPPETIEGKPPSVFYCIQEDLNVTLVNKTLNQEGFGTCNISGELVTCPIEIECKMSEADSCCEDEQGTPYCCGGPVPEEFASMYGGYGDDMYDTATSINQILNVMTAVCLFLATMCFSIWHHRGQ